MVYSGLDNTVVVIHNEVATFTSLMGPVKKLVPVSTKAENVVPSSCTIELPAVQKLTANSPRSPSWRTRNLSCTARS